VSYEDLNARLQEECRTRRELAANRGAADAAGTHWKTATYRHIRSEIEKGAAMTVHEISELGKVESGGILSLRTGSTLASSKCEKGLRF